MADRLRRAGSPWRILVHEWLGKGAPTKYGTAHHVTNESGFGGRTGNTEGSMTHLIPGTEFDELVVGRWIHVEQLDTGRWWLDIGGVTVQVVADRAGRPRHVSVFGPGDYAEPVDGCEYELSWSAPERRDTPHG